MLLSTKSMVCLQLVTFVCSNPMALSSDEMFPSKDLSEFRVVRQNNWMDYNWLNLLKRLKSQFRIDSNGSNFRFANKRNLLPYLEYLVQSMPKNLDSQQSELSRSLLNYLGNNLQANQNSAMMERYRLKRHPDLDVNEGLLDMDSSAMHVRPARENRRYLLWRKITG